MRTRTTTRLFLFSAALVAPLAMSAPALAGFSLGAELGPQVITGDFAVGDSSVGFGAAVRAGYRLDLPLLKITPEAKVAYDSLPFLFDTKLAVIRAMGGARVTLGALFSPVAYAHIGYGNCGGDCTAGGGLALDFGAGLDFTLLPIIDLGVYAGYNLLSIKSASGSGDSASLTWVSVGAQVSFSF